MPKINTERLVLRGFTAQDYERFADLWCDPVVTQHIGVPARSRAESWRSLLNIAGNWMLLGFGQWAISERANGAFLGQVGFFRAARGYGAKFDKHPETGWVLAANAFGHGYGGEAAQAAHNWFDQNIGGGQTVAQISPQNAASQALAQKLGYRVFGSRASDDIPVKLFRRG